MSYWEELRGLIRRFKCIRHGHVPFSIPEPWCPYRHICTVCYKVWMNLVEELNDAD